MSKPFYENGPPMIVTTATMTKISNRQMEKDILKRFGAKSKQ